MIPSFDIFEVESLGVRWLGSAATIEDAKARVREIASSSPGEYLLLDQRTGNRLSFNFKSTQAAFGR